MIYIFVKFNLNVLATNQCALNCRAIGYRFYATLKPKVIDGTSCNGTNDPTPYVCVEGQCKVSHKHITISTGCNTYHIYLVYLIIEITKTNDFFFKTSSLNFIGFQHIIYYKI